VPAHTTAAGKAFLAYLPRAAFDRAVAGGLKRHTEFSITSPGKLERELRQVRERGFAVNDQENELESCGVASVVRNFRGEACAVLTVAVPKHRFAPRQRDAIAAVVTKAAGELSGRLGWAPGAAEEAR
jgi:DNA-binding IclR family transcriptional regulator